MLRSYDVLNRSIVGMPRSSSGMGRFAGMMWAFRPVAQELPGVGLGDRYVVEEQRRAPGGVAARIGVAPTT
jgi:hypothetical protein